MKKNVLSIAATAVLLSGLAACSSTTSTSGSTSEAPGPDALKNAKGVTTITLWHGITGSNGDQLQKLIDQFNDNNKGKIRVTSTFQGAYADLLAKYTASLRSKSAPTVMIAGDVATGYMTDVKQSIPAADMARANPGDLKLDDLVPAASSYYAVNGVQQAVPFNVSTPMLWVNRDLLRQAGIPDSAPLKTLDQVVSAAKTVYAKTGVNGFTMPDDDWYIEQLTSSSGENFCTPDNGRKGKAPTGIAINRGTAKEAINKIADLYTSGAAVDGDPQGNAAYDIFVAGKVAFDFYSSGVNSGFKSDAKFDFQALPFPTNGPKASSGPIIGGSSLWLSSTAKPAAQVAGWKLESFLASAKSQEQFSQATGYIPVNKKTLESSSEKKFLAADKNAQAFVDQVTNTPAVTQTAGCVTGAMTTIRTGNINQLQAAFAGQKSVDEALNQAASDAKTALQQYKSQLGN